MDFSDSFRDVRSSRRARESGSVLIIVLWVAFGLIALALYFANSMALELRASDNRAAAIEADQAILGAARYVSNVIATVREPATLPDINNYRSEQVPVGDATFWLIGRSDRATTGNTAADQVYFGLVDESSKLDLNAPWLTVDLLLALPGMTTELAAAILDWRDVDSEVNAAGGAEDETYQRRNPAYRCKNGPFESVEEMRLLNGAYLELLYGEDANLNGTLDSNENDADGSAPMDDRDGRLKSGMFDYFTVFSKQPALDQYGSTRLNVTTLNTAAGRNNLTTLLNTVGVGNAQEIVGRFQAGNINSILQFYIVSQMTEEDFMKLEPSLTTADAGCVNVNTASEAVLSCIPGIGLDNAPTLVAARRSNANRLNSIAWMKDAFEQPVAIQMGRYLIGRTYNIAADIAAVGHHGRGYRRVKFVFDTSEGSPMIRYRQDLTHLGWALGKYTRQQLQLANNTSRR